jgi:putative tricarboxylic transport membrane protein
MRVINLPGAGGGVAFANAVAQRGNDSSVLYAASPATTLRLAQGQFGHLTAQDVRWVGSVGAEYGILAVRNDSPWRSLGDLVEAWRLDPESLIVSGGSAVAGQDHMKILLLARRARIDPRRIRYVAFDGGGEAMTALLGGFVDVFSGEASEVEGQVEAGDVRVLAVLSGERLGGLLAGVPTARESGYDLEWITWRGFYVPGEVPDSAYDRWAEALDRLNESEPWQRAQAENRLRPFSMSGPQFEAFVMQQVREFREMSREIGLLR